MCPKVKHDFAYLVGVNNLDYNWGGKQNGTMESTQAHWMVTDKTELLEFLQDHILEGGDGVNLKTVTWTAAAKVVDENQTKGAPENAIACKNKFAGVHLFPFILV
jgi:hypothetical protein